MMSKSEAGTLNCSMIWITAAPLSFMYVKGVATNKRRLSIRHSEKRKSPLPSSICERNDCDSDATTPKPTLCLVDAYRLQGLPNPTTHSIFSESASSSKIFCNEGDAN